MPMATTQTIIESPRLISRESAGQDTDAESMVSTYQNCHVNIDSCIILKVDDPEATESITATQLLSQTCSQVPTRVAFPELQLELENMRARMEVSFRNILRAVGLPYSPSDASSTDNRQSNRPGVVEDSLSLIIDDIVLGRHTL